MDCFTTRTARLRPSEKSWIASRLTRPGSDFQKVLEAGEPQGWIAVALDQGEIVGWCRTERWRDWDTLEAFVDPAFRGRGVATWCAMALAASNVLTEESAKFVAVFRPAMISLAARAGLHPVRFDRQGDGEWMICR